MVLIGFLNIYSKGFKMKNGKMEIKNGVRITDYSKGKGDLHIKFEYKGQDNDLNDDLQFNGSYIEFKFKDPRDALKELVKNWKVYNIEISLKLLDYVNYGISLGNYTPLQVYYHIILNFQIYFTAEFIDFNGNPPELTKDSTEEERIEYLKKCELYEEDLNTQTRISHIWAVANTWWYFHHYSKEDSEISKMDKYLLFNNYKGKNVKYATEFLLIERLWKVVFEDESWLIAFDVGNGWYKAMTDFDSYKNSLNSASWKSEYESSDVLQIVQFTKGEYSLSAAFDLSANSVTLTVAKN